MLRIFKDTYRNVDTAEYRCSTGGFLWIVISCAEYLHAWIWWICVCLNFPWPPVLIYCNPSPISESFKTWLQRIHATNISCQFRVRPAAEPHFPSLKAPLWARPSPVDTDVEKAVACHCRAVLLTVLNTQMDDPRLVIKTRGTHSIGVSLSGTQISWVSGLVSDLALGIRTQQAEKPTLSMRGACCLHPRHCHGEFAKQLKHRTQVVQRIEANEMEWRTIVF